MIEVFSDLFGHEDVAAAASAWPSPDWPHWFRYDSAIERKSTCSDWLHIPGPCRRLLCQMLLCAPPGTYADTSLYGAGMHSMQRGDHLDLHLDADRHKMTGDERAANMILFLNPSWEKEWGGSFELWDAGINGPLVSVSPFPGNAMIFQTNDHSVHGVPGVLQCPDDVARMTLAVYFWRTTSHPGKRPRAKFLAGPGERDEDKDRLRMERK